MARSPSGWWVVQTQHVATKAPCALRQKMLTPTRWSLAEYAAFINYSGGKLIRRRLPVVMSAQDDETGGFQEDTIVPLASDPSLRDQMVEEPCIRARVLKKMSEIVSFALPILLVPLADPILSLIDTIFLGHYGGSFQLASLSPCTLILNFAFYSFTALTIATISLIAGHLRNEKYEEARKLLSTSLFLALSGGIVIMAVLSIWGPRLLLTTGCDPLLLPYSEKYLAVRALAAPAALMTSVLQGCFIAQKITKQPVLIVLMSIVLSALGDFILIGLMDLGVAGAAWTTFIAQVFSAAMLLLTLQRTPVFVAFQVPSWQDMVELVRFAGSLGIFYIAKTSSYLILQASATRLPAMSLAAHQPIFSLWAMCSFMNGPLENAAIAFLPTTRNLSEKKDLILALLASGALLSFFCSCISVGIPSLMPQLLTSDTTLWPIMRSVWLPGLVAMFSCGYDVSSTGILLGERDTAYVARAMVVSLCVMFASVSIGAVWAGSHTLSVVWWALAAFFISRVLQSFPRVVLTKLQR